MTVNFFLVLFVSAVLQAFLPAPPGWCLWVQLCTLQPQRLGCANQQLQGHSKTSQVLKWSARTDTRMCEDVPSIAPQESSNNENCTMGNFSVLSYNQQGLGVEWKWIIHTTVQPKLIADLQKNDSNYN